MKKAISFLLVFSILFSFLSLFACANDAAPSEEKKTVVFLGDSIAEAVAGPTPFNEREHYGYYGIIGNINEFEYYNRAVSGSTTKNLLDYVQREDDGVQHLRSLLKAADLIHISIIGNDLLLSGRNRMLRDIARGDTTTLYARRDTAKENLDQTLSFIRSLNPNATILLQTLYNPVAEDSPLVPSSIRPYLADYGYTPERYHELMKIAVDELNSVLLGYIDENKESEETNPYAPIYVTDVYSEMEKAFENDRENWDRLFIEDGIHPSNEGHAIIADVLQTQITSLGFSGKNTLSNYKKLKVEQLERLYPAIENKNDIVRDIRSAKSLKEASSAYFDGTRNQNPKNELTLTYQGNHFEDTKVYMIEKLAIMHVELMGFVNPNKTYVRFFPDGKFEMTAELNATTTRLLKSTIDGSAPFDLGESADLDQLVPYLDNIFPGADQTNLKNLLTIFETAYGIALDGIDYEGETFRAMEEEFKTGGRILIPSSDLFGEKIHLIYKGQYKIVSVTSPLTKEKMTAIRLNDSINRGESYMQFTLTKKENGDEALRMIVDVLNFEVEASLRK